MELLVQNAPILPTSCRSRINVAVHQRADATVPNITQICDESGKLALGRQIEIVNISTTEVLGYRCSSNGIGQRKNSRSGASIQRHYRNPYRKSGVRPNRVQASQTRGRSCSIPSQPCEIRDCHRRKCIAQKPPVVRISIYAVSQANNCFFHRTVGDTYTGQEEALTGANTIIDWNSTASAPDQDVHIAEIENPCPTNITICHRVILPAHTVIHGEPW